MIPREANLLGQVIRQEVHELAVTALVEEGLVGELGFFVGEAVGRFGVGGVIGVVRNGEVEVEGWRRCVSVEGQGFGLGPGMGSPRGYLLPFRPV